MEIPQSLQSIWESIVESAKYGGESTVVTNPDFCYFSLYPAHDEIVCTFLYDNPYMEIWGIDNIKEFRTGYLVRYKVHPVKIRASEHGMSLFNSNKPNFTSYDEVNVAYSDSKFRIIEFTLQTDKRKKPPTTAQDFYLAVKWKSTNPTDSATEGPHD